MSEGLEFFRCTLCHGVVSVWDIREGGCQKCGGRRIKPSSLTFVEKVQQLIKHPKVWEWKDEHIQAN